jgi:hypothetical protein
MCPVLLYHTLIYTNTPLRASTNNHAQTTSSTHTHLEARMTYMENRFKNTDARLTKIETNCADLKNMCSHTLEVLQRLTANHEAAAYQRNDTLHHKQIRPNENTVTCDTPVKITLIPQLDQGNEEVIRVALLTFDLKR